MADTVTTILGPIIVHRPRGTKGSEKSSGQTLSYNTIDSRLAVTSTTWLKYSRIREIRQDATVQLARQAVVAPIVHTPWSYEVTEGAPQDAEKFVVDIMEPQRDWLLQNALYNALDFGWAPFEVVYKPKNGAVVIDEFKQLLPDFTTILVYLENGKFAGFANEPTQIGYVATSVEIYRPYALNINLCYEGTDWYGQSVSWVLDPICDAWDDVDKTANRYDRKLAGATWVLYYPVGSTIYEGVETANSEIAAALLAELEASGAVAIPDEVQEWLDDSVDKELKGKWRVELISASASTQASFIDRMRYLDTLKIRAFGIPERSILEGRFGTKAEAEAHADIALSTIDTKHRLVCDQINEQVIRPLLRMNYGREQEKCVQIQPAPIVDAQFQTVKEIYRLLVQSPEVIAHELQNLDVQSLRDQIGIPTIAGAKNDYAAILEQKQMAAEAFNQDKNTKEEDK
jgi:hypothetical protein